MDNRLARKVALVTGAARGQGRNHAIRLAQEGAAIIAIDICAPVDGISYPMATQEDLVQTEELVAATGAEVFMAVVDTRDFDLLSSTLQRAVLKMGGLDIVVANAGVAVTGQSEKISQEQWDAAIGVNLTGTWNTFRASTPYLLQRGAGSIVAIASVAGLAGLPFLDPYVASKHAVIGLVRALSLQLAEKDIRVNAICPSWVTATGMEGVRADIFENAGSKLRSTFENGLITDAVDKADVSDVVLYLASDEARFVTGATLPVNGGLPTF